MILPPGRAAPTHSEYGWNDLVAEALGEYGMHPWEFYRYTFREFLAKRKGYTEKELREWHRVRVLSFFAASGNLKSGTKIHQLFPLPGDKGYKTQKMSIEQIRLRQEILSKTTPPKAIRNGRSGT